MKDHILILDRQNKPPKYNQFKYIKVKENFLFGNLPENAKTIDLLCKKNQIKLFISTYFTYATTVKSLMILHDFIPEKLGYDLHLPEWADKKEAILNNNIFVSISNSTLTDFHRYYPEMRNRPVKLIYNAAYDNVRLNSSSSSDFLEKYSIEKKFFLLVGHRWPHKNHILFLKAINELKGKDDFEIIFTGGNAILEDEFQKFLSAFKYKVKYKVLQLSLSEMIDAYKNAMALVYPSKYEGFGLPILEAMQCGCPVITCKNSSIEEIGQDACLYCDENDHHDLKNALIRIQDKETREKLIRRGREISKEFSWEKSTQSLIHFIEENIK